MKRNSVKPTKLTIELSKANDEITIIYLLNVCDRLYNGEKNVNGFTVKDLPPDSVYEEYKNKIKHDDSNKIENLPIMYMGSIPKEKEVKIIENAILMPKFDGCSVALRFKFENDKEATLIQSHTRGADVGSERVNNDLTEKMKLLIPKIYFKEDSLTNKLLALLPTFINIRGEIVLKEKELDENGFHKTAPASDVAGKINGGIEVFKNYLSKIRICGFEISKIELANGKEKIFTQKLVLKLLKNIYYFDAISEEKIYLKDYEAYRANTNEIDFDEMFELYNENDPRPLDGIVYCDADWKYPSKLEDTTATRYGKFAWKPNNEFVVTIKNVEYSMSRDGDYSPMILFEPIKLDKKYQRAKSAISKLNILIEEGLGNNAKAILKINHGINPQIFSVTSPSTNSFKLPEFCLFCGCELQKEYNPKTNELIHLRCTNNECTEIILQRYIYLLDFMYKKCKLTTVNEKGVIIKSKLSDKGLRKLTKGKLTIKLIMDRIPNLKIEFNKLSLLDQLCALSFGKKQKVEKKIKAQNIKKLEDIKDELWCDIL